MKLLHLALHGMRSFRQQQELEFEQLKPGLYYLTGDNLVEPELAANGIGKSSLLDALFWLFYGKTSRNLRAGAVKSWNQKGSCFVEAAFELNGHTYLLQRSWGPNFLRLSSEIEEAADVDQARIDKLIGLSPEAFLSSILFAQFTPSFADLQPAERMALYSAVMDLDRWESQSAAASATTKQLENEVQQLRIAIAQLDGELKTLKATNARAQMREWDKEQKTFIIEAQAKLKAAERAVEEKRRKITKPNEQKLVVLQQQIGVTRDKISETRALLRRAESDLIEANAAAKQGKCPICGQVWKSPKASHVATHQQTVAKLQKTINQSDSVYTKLMEEHQTLETAARLARTAESDLKQAEATLPMLREQLEQLKAETNPHEATAKQIATQLRGVTNQIEKQRATLSETEQLAEATGFWVKGFKDVRLFLIEDSLAHLNVEVNEALFQLGLQEWKIEFAAEQETKSGGIKRGFQCSVWAPGAPEAVPWEAWSGGEGQRLRLAVNLGVAELICQQRGINPNVLFFDEPSTWLSEPGIQSLLTLLEERAKRQQKVILLADHRALDFGGFTGTIYITKDTTGSHIKLL